MRRQPVSATLFAGPEGSGRARHEARRLAVYTCTHIQGEASCKGGMRPRAEGGVGFDQATQPEKIRSGSFRVRGELQVHFVFKADSSALTQVHIHDHAHV